MRRNRRLPFWEILILVAVTLGTSAAHAEEPTSGRRFRRLESGMQVVAGALEETVIPQVEEDARRIEELNDQLNVLRRQSIGHQNELETQRARYQESIAACEAELTRQRQLNEALERRVAALEVARAAPPIQDVTLAAVRQINRELELRTAAIQAARHSSYAEPASAGPMIRLTPTLTRRLNGYSWSAVASSGNR